MPNRGYVHRADSKAKLSDAAARQWQDPKTRAKMIESLRAAWARRRQGLDICTTCGRPFEDETGRG